MNLILSTSPLWLGSIIALSLSLSAPKTFGAYGNALLQSMSGGELLLFATASIAPIFYFSLTPPPDRERDYPSRLSHIVSGLLIFMICTALFGAQRAGGHLDPNFIFAMSVVIYLFALVIIFIAIVYRNWRDSREVIGQRYVTQFEDNPEPTDEKSFLEKVRRHREQGDSQ